MLLIERGTARLLGEQDGRLSTLSKLEAGELVGAASLLRGSPCEDVRAASELVRIPATGCVEMTSGEKVYSKYSMR